MATKLANALRAQAAIDRITQAVAGVTGTPLALPTHRDPEIERALCYEAIADALEAKSGKAAATTTAPAGAVGSVTKETVQITSAPTANEQAAVDVDLDAIDPSVDLVELPDGSTLERDKPKPVGRGRSK